MTLPPWHEEPIGRHHDREQFDCGEPALNDFLRHHARKSHERGGAKTFLAVADAEVSSVLGFYSLSPASVAYAHTPEMIRRGLARYDVPVFRLGRLAVARAWQGHGLGGQLLLLAGRRCLLLAGRRCLLAASEVGGVALLIDAKSASVARWYERYGAAPLIDQPLSLLLPLATLQAALVAAGKL